jgi:O-succinylbenzoate synthase
LAKIFLSIDSAIASYEKVRGHMMAKAGLEAALWDLFAKSKNISLSKMMGGTRNKIDVGVSIGIQSSVPDLIKKIEGYLARRL